MISVWISLVVVILLICLWVGYQCDDAPEDDDEDCIESYRRSMNWRWVRCKGYFDKKS